METEEARHCPYCNQTKWDVIEREINHLDTRTCCADCAQEMRQLPKPEYLTHA